ncbi:McrB family protein [Pedobacter namyangjuensis]|uniref:McrB family protein n=1 Tax=Pedobacter namyangjuensis TaxID=600626 RepID=UPI000DE1E2D0|nr:AAA family ATPase [Pedobacter namyangjuensis]
MVPNNITRHHVLQAIEDIDKNGLRYPLGKSMVYDLVYNGKPYPPKHVVVVANEYANGKLLGHKELDTKEAQNFLKGLGDEFTIVLKNNDPVLKLIEDYKDDLLKKGLSDEIYKWELLATYGGRPNLDAVDFGAEIKSINYKNLIYHNGIAVRNHIVIDNGDLYRECFIKLFDENIELEHRILAFQTQISIIYRGMGETLSHHHDERSIATFLTVKFPNKYSFYKNSFYIKYCKLKNIATAKKNQIYVHYLALMDEFIDGYIRPDSELLDIINTSLPNGVFDDKNHRLLAQDILYKMLDKKAPSFTNTILELEASMLESENVLNKFSINKSRQYFKDNGFDSRKKDSFVWIADAERKIGNKKAHYEISIRTRGEMKNNFFVDLHFEDFDKFKFIGLIGNDLPEKLEWVDWQEGSKSIGTVLGISPTDEDLVEKLMEQLLYMETNIGQIVRETMDKEINSSDDGAASVGPSKNYPLNQILFGPPGTGKTYHTINKALSIIESKSEEVLALESREVLKERYQSYVTNGQIVFTTFHQSMSYEDFVEGIKPEIEKNENGKRSVVYDVKDGIFKEICTNSITPNQVGFDLAYVSLSTELSSIDGGILELITPKGKSFGVSLNSNGNLSLHTGLQKEKQGTLTKENLKKQIAGEEKFIGWEGYFIGVINYLKQKHNYTEKTSDEKKYVLIIDEINRGNVSSIFGELITLIEESKRKPVIVEHENRCRETIEVVLPYSKQKFSVPSNLYIIGTMNTADRSVEALDTALRRRFAFEEMMPEPSRITYDGALKESAGILEGVDLATVLTRINERIAILLDVDHQIGHSYLINVYDTHALANAFNNCIIPLLKEYFYHDDEKMAMVLGAGFVNAKKQIDNVQSLFPVMDDLEVYAIDGKRQFELRPITGETIIAALQTLLSGG